MTDETRDKIFEAVKRQAIEVLDCAPEDVTGDALLSETLDADSIDVIEIAGALEREFNVSIEDHEVYDLDTVDAMVNLVQSKL